MKKLKMRSSHPFEGVLNILNEQEQLSIICGRISQAGYYYFTREEMLEMFETESNFPSAFSNSLFKDEEESTPDHDVYIRYWFISISDYEDLMNRFSFSESGLSGSSTFGSESGQGSDFGSHSDNAITLEATKICTGFYNYVKNANVNITYEQFQSMVYSDILAVIKRVFQSGNTDINVNYNSDGLSIVCTISNHYGISESISYQKG